MVIVTPNIAGAFGGPQGVRPCDQCGEDCPDYFPGCAFPDTDYCCSSECRRALKVRRELAPHPEIITFSPGILSPRTRQKIKSYLATIRPTKDKT